MGSAPFTIEVPYQNKVIDDSGLIERAWSIFFRNTTTAVDPLGIERTFEIINNKGVATDIEGLSFDKTKVSQASVDYLIQRVTTGGLASELIETGTFYAAYKPTSVDWVLSDVPSTAGVTLTITSSGQVQYTSTNITGATAYISKITFRVRTLGAKNDYSKMGR